MSSSLIRGKYIIGRVIDIDRVEVIEDGAISTGAPTSYSTGTPITACASVFRCTCTSSRRPTRSGYLD